MRCPGERLSRTGGAVAGALAILLIGGVVDHSRADDAAGKSSASVTLIEAAKLTSGSEIYAHICQGCHMPDAQGASGAGRYPKLAGDPALVSWEYVAITVLNGKNGMPSFGEKPGAAPPMFAANLTDAQVAEVVNYVRSHFGNRFPSRATAEQVARLPHPGGTPEE